MLLRNLLAYCNAKVLKIETITIQNTDKKIDNVLCYKLLSLYIRHAIRQMAYACDIYILLSITMKILRQMLGPASPKLEHPDDKITQLVV